MAKKDNITIKKVYKIEGGGHHGGAWKVAYADFVTAMMAFFLLMWLLNATEAENLSGLADYFAPTVGVKDQMGIGFRGGKSALSEGIGADKNTNKGVVFGGVPTGPITKVTKKIEERTDEVDQEQIKILVNETTSDKKGEGDQGESAAQSVSEETKQENEEFNETQKALNAYAQDMIKNRRIEEGSIEIKRTPEGLLIEIKDLDGNSMFKEHSPEMRENLKTALLELSKILRNIPNNIAIIGHTSSQPVQGAQGYTKWELSADRANATRTFLEKNNFQPEQISRIEGRADNLPYDKRRPESSVNNRINIILLKKSDTPGHKKSAPDTIFMDIKNTPKGLELEKPKEEKKTEQQPATQLKPDANIQKLLDSAKGVPAELNKAPVVPAIPSPTPAPAK